MQERRDISFYNFPIKNLFKLSEPQRNQQNINQLRSEFMSKYADYIECNFKLGRKTQQKHKIKVTLRIYLPTIQRETMTQLILRKWLRVKDVRLITLFQYQIYSQEQSMRDKKKEDIARTVKDKIPDYISLVFHRITLGQKISLQKEIGYYEGQSSQISLQSSNIHFYEEKSKKISIFYYSFSESFSKIMDNTKNNKLKDRYRYIKNKQTKIDNDKHMRESGIVRGNSAIENLRYITVNIISLANGKRLRSGVWHYDCNHPQKVHIFDLENLLITLFPYYNDKDKLIQPTSFSVRCIYCASQFTQKNILQKSMFFQQINEILISQNFYEGKVYYGNKEPLMGEEYKRMDIQNRVRLGLITNHPQQSPQAITKKCNEIIRLITISITQFWNLQDHKKYTKYMKQIHSDFKSNNQLFFQIQINYNEIFYPVRFNKCKHLGFSDLWSFFINYYLLQDLMCLPKDIKPQKLIKCQVCRIHARNIDDFSRKFKPDESYVLQKQVYTLMQYNLINIRYEVKYQRWLPDIRNIQFKEGVNTHPLQFVMMYLTVHQRSYKKQQLSYYKKNFLVIKEICTKTECFILKECLKKNDSFNHIIYIDKHQFDQTMWKCPTCEQQQSFSIFDLIYDQELSTNIQKRKKNWNALSQQFQDNPEQLFRPQEQLLQIDNILSNFQSQYLELPNLQLINNHHTNMSNQRWEQEISQYGGGIYIYHNEQLNLGEQ